MAKQSKAEKVLRAQLVTEEQELERLQAAIDLHEMRRTILQHVLDALDAADAASDSDEAA